MKARITLLLNDANNATNDELRVILISTVVISLLLSLTQVMADPVINSDGILYVQAASFIQNEAWASAMQTI